MSASLARWSVWADTGGTFTDCIALSPEGLISRVKVLSSSTLRGRALAAEDGATLRIVSSWAGVDGLVTGFAFRPLSSTAATAHVAGFIRATGELRLDRQVEIGPLPFDFELRSPEEAPVLAARIATGVSAADPLPLIRMRVATTRGTNALLQRNGARVALFVTRGFRDVLLIGTQQRPDLFTLRIQKCPPLYAQVLEVAERTAADGTILQRLDEERLRRSARAALREGAETAAVALINATRNPSHELRAAEILRDAGFSEVSISSRLAASIGHLARTQTSVVNAYLQPTVDRYVERVASSVGRGEGGTGASLHLMTSSGGLLGPAEFSAKDSLLSGPAAGVVGASAAGRSTGYDRLITFDMGGTSTDVARFHGRFDYVWSHKVGDTELLAPALAIESVAAGGGSICGFGRDGLFVGPESAGAVPGPACYGAGGPLTITDCNLLLGRIDPGRFGFPLDRAAAEEALDRLVSEVERSTGLAPERVALLAGLVAIADERMADAIRAISLRRGYDPGEYALVSFGGAGGQHACSVAERLGMSVVVVPADAGLLSAWGLGDAAVQRIAERQILRAMEPGQRAVPDWLADELREVEEQAVDAVSRQGVPPADVTVVRRIGNLRLLGQDATLPIELDRNVGLYDEFVQAFRDVYGHSPELRSVEVESIRVVAAASAKGESILRTNVPRPDSPAEGRETRAVWLDGFWRQLPARTRSTLSAEARVEGPALIDEEHTSVLVPEGWTLRADSAGALVLTRAAGAAGARAAAPEHAPGPVLERLFTSRFESLVGEMGERLRTSALSTNVKERLDFSCALLDSAGELVANAPHIPVHLGAMGLCVRSIAAAIPFAPGDVVVTNHPAFGGSHLPDVTVVTPVFTDDDVLLGYVANRAHHAEIGGTRPGSMPPDATSLAEEGVVIPPTRLIAGGVADWEALSERLTATPYPTRALRDNLADLRAQVAANQHGSSLLRALATENGAPTVRDQMTALTDRAERMVREALARLGLGRFHASERLDDRSVIAVEITISEAGARFDFGGTSPPHPGNLNATPAIVRSAVLYVLRLLVDEPIPLNEGMLRPVELSIPLSLLDPGFEVDPTFARAVVGGNTEVSQRLVDTMLKALGIAACSQGTMNNLLWGSDRFGYYETIAGGEGASEGHEGASGVHTHMTNTRITDVEVVEHRYPVRIDRFEVRRGSGGEGAWRGGDGLVREMEFLESVEVSVLTQHRREGPYGLAGGSRGAAGAQWLVRSGGARVDLGPIDGVSAAAGDRLTIQTPGGGGYGRPDSASTPA